MKQWLSEWRALLVVIVMVGGLAFLLVSAIALVVKVLAWIWGGA